MLTSKIKRLGELEQRIAARHRQAAEQRRRAIWAHFSRDERERVIASAERREQPGYVLTAEDEAIDQRWLEAVLAVLPESEWLRINYLDWALAWCEAVRSHA